MYKFFLIIIFLTFNIYAAGNKLMDSKSKIGKMKWFEKINCEKLIVTQYESLSSQSVSKQITINDSQYIRSLQSEINQLPVSGDEFKKVGPDVDYLTLNFICEGKNQILKFFSKTIQTPATSFYSRLNSPDRYLWDQVESLFKPATVGKLAPRCMGLEIKFDHFTIKYMGSEDKTPKGLTASSHVETFIVISKNDLSIQSVKIRSGQLPPTPEEFIVENKTYILSTYSKQNELNIKPTTFLVKEK